MYVTSVSASIRSAYLQSLKTKEIFFIKLKLSHDFLKRFVQTPPQIYLSVSWHRPDVYAKKEAVTFILALLLLIFFQRTLAVYNIA